MPILALAYSREGLVSNVRLKIKVGAVELEVEAPEAFVLDRFPSLVTQVLKENGWTDIKQIVQPSATVSNSDGGLDQSTNTIAALLDAKTGPDLALAACAHMSLVKGKMKFSRKDVLDEMQAAATFYNHNYSGNLTKILQSLMKAKKLNLVANQTYSLPKAQVEYFQGILKEE